MEQQSEKATSLSYKGNTETFKNAFDIPAHNVPIERATETGLENLGRIVRDFDKEEVINSTWPCGFSWRKVCPNTGNKQAPVTDIYKIYWVDDYLIGDNIGMGEVGTGYLIGRLDRNQTKEDRKGVLVREVNYHPDGGQVFCPRQKGTSFIMLLAPPGDDVKLTDFRAFYFDGSFGLQMYPNVWHTTPLHRSDSIVMNNKQSSVFGCVALDFVAEFGRYLRVPLNLN